MKKKRKIGKDNDSGNSKKKRRIENNDNKYAEEF